jgi:AcrR family transcriptional regulator
LHLVNEKKELSHLHTGYFTFQKEVWIENQRNYFLSKSFREIKKISLHAEIFNMKEEVIPILENTAGLFMRYGIKSITMDDVAKESGISKKTLYQHFTDRSTLVDSTLGYYLEKIELACSGICGEIKNPIDQMLEIGVFFREIARELNPSLLFDLKKYFPGTWKKFHEHRINFIEKNIADNIRLGISLGLYRNDFNIDTVTRIYISMVNLIVSDEEFSSARWDIRELHQEVLMYHLHGIMTAKGKNYLKAKQNTHE